MSDLTRLRTFLEAFRAGSLSRAAERLSLSQPTATAHLQTLEGAVGKPLFERFPRGLKPTPAAEALARSIAPHLDALEQALREAKARSGAISGTVHVAAPAEFADAVLARAAPALISEGLQLRVQTGGRERLYALLKESAVDLAITASEPPDASLGWSEIGRERLRLVANAETARRLAPDPLVEGALLRHPLIAYDEDLPLVREWFKRTRRGHADYTAAATFPDLRAIVTALVNGPGWSVIPEHLCAAKLIEGALKPLDSGVSSPTNTFHLVWNKGALRHARVAFARDVLAQILPPLIATDHLETGPRE